MAFFKEIEYTNGTHIYKWSVTESVDNLRNMCNSKGINIDEIANIKAQSRQTELLVEQLLLYIIFNKATTLLHKPNGAPYILESDLNISISHTVGYVCIATHPTQLIGIDIELLGTRVIKVRDKFLNENEKRWISKDNITANLIAWTAKEALFKVVPQDEIDFREHLQLQPFKAVDFGQITYNGTVTRTATSQIYNITTDIELDYVLSLAVAHSDNAQHFLK